LFSGSSVVFGDYLEDGLDAYIRKDYKEALRFYRLSAEQGDAWAQYQLGEIYDKGQGVPQDYKEAVKWFRLAAEQGHVYAQRQLGDMYYFNERGVLQDYKEAVKWYRLSAEQGNGYAQRQLGNMYFDGRGVLQDYVLTHMWYNLAGSNGDELAIVLRDGLVRKWAGKFIMTPSQIEKAQEMARNWKPKK
jgi:hypothetical protein